MSTVLDRSLDRLKELDFQFGCMLNTIYSTREALWKHVTTADLVIGAVLVPGAAAHPKLVTREMLAAMRPGSVVVDVAIDQGGCFETSRATTPLRPHVCRRRCGALLRRKHARRRGTHFHFCPQQCNPALHPGAGGQGLYAGTNR